MMNFAVPLSSDEAARYKYVDINANFLLDFRLKMQIYWRIAPEKR